MTRNDNRQIGRRPVLKGAGAALAGATGLASPVAAKGNGNGGKQPLNDRPADLMLYWSIGGDPDGDDPNSPEDFGYPGPPSPGPPGGLFLAAHDGEDGPFDFSKIVMTPNGGTLHNAWTFFYGLLLASKPKPYPLVHLGNGVYESRGQVMRFTAQEANGEVTRPNDIDRLRYPEEAGPLANQLYPPVAVLEGESWHAAATERAVLALDDDGNPTQDPQIAATRVDFYTAGRKEYKLSLLYLIWYSESTSVDPIPGLPLESGGSVPADPGDVHSLAIDLITGGRLNPGGQ